MAVTGAIAAVVGAVGGIAGQADASRRASHVASNAADRADPFGSQRPQYQDWLSSNFPLLSSPNPEDILKNPNFQFMKAQGDMGIKNLNSSVFGSPRNGTLFEDMGKFDTGIASGFINDQFNRNMASLSLGADLSGARIGAPGQAGQILATAGQNAVGNQSDMWGQVGGGMQLLSRYRGSSGGLNPAFTSGSTNTGWTYDTGMGGGGG